MIWIIINVLTLGILVLILLILDAILRDLSIIVGIILIHLY